MFGQGGARLNFPTEDESHNLQVNMVESASITLTLDLAFTLIIIACSHFTVSRTCWLATTAAVLVDSLGQTVTRRRVIAVMTPYKMVKLCHTASFEVSEMYL